MKIAIYSPYLDTLGGGERYMMTIAEVLSADNQVDVLLDAHLYSLNAKELINKLSERFGLNLSKINLVQAPLGIGSNFLRRTICLREYDLLIYLTDGSIFYPAAAKNILHIQSPIIGQPAKSLWGKLKLSGWDLIIYNSKFTQDNCQKYWKAKSKVLYPPVDVDLIKPLRKEKKILSVGRFFNFLRDKKHEVLINAFENIYDEKLAGWSLNLVGSAGEGDEPYLEELEKQAAELPINFFPNLKYDDLIKLYGASSIYWHAAGFGEDNPTKMEHFGISTVEAMAGGCVPVVINKGGQPEVIGNKEAGFLWNDLEELAEFTIKIISDENLRKRVSQEAIQRAQMFSKKNFIRNILEVSLS